MPNCIRSNKLVITTRRRFKCGHQPYSKGAYLYRPSPQLCCTSIYPYYLNPCSLWPWPFSLTTNLHRKTFLHWHRCKPTLDMSKPSQASLLIHHQLILRPNAPESAPFSFYPNFTTNPSQHSHLCNTHFLYVLFPNWPTFCSISHS